MMILLLSITLTVLQSSSPTPSINPLSATPPGLNQSVAPLYGSSFALVVSGQNFVENSVIQAGGLAIPTTFVSSTEIRGIVPSSKLIVAGALSITVSNSGSLSNSVDLTVVERGDVNRNRAVNIGDALNIALAVGGITKPSLPLSVGDANLNGSVNIGDALVLALFAGGISPNLPGPTIDSVSSNPAVPGSTLVIRGTGFAAEAANNQVAFTRTGGVVRVAPSIATTTTLTVTVPIDAASGSLQVYRLDTAIGGGPYPLVISNTPTPLVIASITPARVAAGSTITIAGLGFDSIAANNLIQFSGSSGPIVVSAETASTTSMTMTVPAGAVCGSVSVRANGQTSPARSVYGLGPCGLHVDGILGLSSPGDVVVIEGRGFDATSPANNTVQFGGMPATVVSAGRTQLNVIVPSNAVDGDVTVQVAGVTSNAVPYHPLPSRPAVSAVTPSSFTAGTVTDVTITGAGFVNGSLSLVIDGGGVNITNVAAFSSSTLNATIRFDATAAEGHRTLIVTTAAGSSDPALINVLPGPMMISDIVPSSATPATLVNVAFSGSGFNGDTTFSVSGTGITLTNVAIVDQNSVRATFNIDAGATLGSRTITARRGSQSSSVAFGLDAPVIGSAVQLKVSTVTGSIYPDTYADTRTLDGVWFDGTAVYVSAAGSHTIRKYVLASRDFSVIAGAISQPPGFADGFGLDARFNRPSGIWGDGANLYIADSGNHVIRKLRLDTGQVTTFAGTPGVAGFADGPAAAARFSSPTGVFGDSNNLYVSDTGNSIIRKISFATGYVATVAGSGGSPDYVDGASSVARFRSPFGIWGDGSNLYVADTGNYTIRRVHISTGQVTTLAGKAHRYSSDVRIDDVGTNAEFSQPLSIWGYGNDLYVGDGGPHYLPGRIRKVSVADGSVISLAGMDAGSSLSPVAAPEGIGPGAKFFSPTGISGDGKLLFFVDASALAPGVLRLAEPVVSAPQLSAIIPESAQPGTLNTVTIRGKNFVPGATEIFGVTATDIDVTDSSTLTARFAVDQGQAGATSVNIRTPAGLAYFRKMPVGEVVLESVTPATISRGVKVRLTIKGNNLLAVRSLLVDGRHPYYNDPYAVYAFTMVENLDNTTMTVDFVVPSWMTNGVHALSADAYGYLFSKNSIPITIVDPPQGPSPLPTLTSISPNSGTDGTTVAVTLTGTNFLPGSTVRLADGEQSGLNPNNVVVVNDTTIQATFTLWLPYYGPRRIIVRNGFGSSGTQTFTVLAAAPPSLDSISPATGYPGQSVNVTLRGSNFTFEHLSFSIGGTGVSVSKVVVVNSTTVNATLTIDPLAAPGARDIRTTTPNGTDAASFTVNPQAPPTLSSVSVTTPDIGSITPIRLIGANFVPGATAVAVSGTGIVVTNVVVTGVTTVTADLSATTGASAGSRSITLVTPNGSSNALTMTFDTAGSTLVTDMSPAFGLQSTTTNVTITGDNFYPGATSVTVSGTGAAVTHIRIPKKNSLIATLHIDSDAAPTMRTVSVTTGNSTSNGTFSILIPPLSNTAQLEVSTLGRFDETNAIWGDAGKYLYLAGTALYRYDLTAGTISNVQTIGLIGTVTGMWGDGAYLYTVNKNESTLRRVDIVTGLVTTLAQLPCKAGSLTGNRTHLFWTNSCDGTTVQISLASGELTTLTSVNAWSYHWADDRNLYVGDSVSLGRFDLSSRTYTTIAGSASNSSSNIVDGTGASAVLRTTYPVWGDGTNIFFLNSNCIRKAEIATGVVTTVAGVCGAYGNRDGTGWLSSFQGPGAAWSDGLALYVLDEKYLRKTIANVTAPVITSLTPRAVSAGAIVSATFAARNLVAGQTILISSNPGVVVLTSTVSGGTVSASLDIDNAEGMMVALRLLTPNGISYPAMMSVGMASNPTLSGIAPSGGVAGKIVDVVITGTNFVSGLTTVSSSGTGVVVSNSRAASHTRLEVTLFVARDAAPGTRSLKISNGINSYAYVPFTILSNATPTITAVLPAIGMAGFPTELTIAGSGFINGATSLTADGAGLTFSALDIRTTAFLKATITVDASAAPGNRTLTLSTPAGSVSFPFAITAASPPTISSISPSSAFRGVSTDITVSGSGFIPGLTTATVAGSGMIVTNTSVINSTTLTVSVLSESTAALGAHDLTVRTPLGTSIATIPLGIAPLSGAIQLQVSTVAAASYFGPIWGTSSNLFLTKGNSIVTYNIASGTQTVLAGGANGRVDGLGDAAGFTGVHGICGDGSVLYVADDTSLRKVVVATREVTTVASGLGSLSAIWCGGDAIYLTTYTSILKVPLAMPNPVVIAGGNIGSADGVGTQARFNYLAGIWGDGVHLYVSDRYNHTIRKIALASDQVSTMAGLVGNGTWADGVGSAARFYRPASMWGDIENVFVLDAGFSVIRKINLASGEVTSVAGWSCCEGSVDGIGPSSRFSVVSGVWGDGTNIWFTSPDLRKGQTVVAVPAVSNLSPASGSRNTTVNITLTGSRFQPDSTTVYSDNPGIIISNVVCTNNTTVTATLSLPNFTTSGYIYVRTAEGTSYPKRFAVTP